jgi:hypothetical protein
VTILLTLALAGWAVAGHRFATITAVDAEKGTITYAIPAGPDKATDVRGVVARECVIKEGIYRLGKPATTKEGDDIAGGLKNAVFKKATAENSVRVDIWTADSDDADKGIKRGDVIKILVNPEPKKKP